MFFLCRKNTLSSKTVLKTKARKKKKQEIPTRNNHRSWFPWIPIKHFFPYHFQTAHINIVLTLRPTTFGRSLNRMFAYYYLTSGDLHGSCLAFIHTSQHPDPGVFKVNRLKNTDSTVHHIINKYSQQIVIFFMLISSSVVCKRQNIYEWSSS